MNFSCRWREINECIEFTPISFPIGKAHYDKVFSSMRDFADLIEPLAYKMVVRNMVLFGG